MLPLSIDRPHACKEERAAALAREFDAVASCAAPAAAVAGEAGSGGAVTGSEGKSGVAASDDGINDGDTTLGLLEGVDIVCLQEVWVTNVPGAGRRFSGEARRDLLVAAGRRAGFAHAYVPRVSGPVTWTNSAAAVQALRAEDPATESSSPADAGAAEHSTELATGAGGSGGGRLALKLIDSGLLVLSRWPIVDTDFHQFSSGADEDALAAKGVAWVRVRVPTQRDSEAAAADAGIGAARNDADADGTEPPGAATSQQVPSEVLVDVFNVHVQSTYSYDTPERVGDGAAAGTLAHPMSDGMALSPVVDSDHECIKVQLEQFAELAAFIGVRAARRDSGVRSSRSGGSDSDSGGDTGDTTRDVPVVAGAIVAGDFNADAGANPVAYRNAVSQLSRRGFVDTSAVLPVDDAARASGTHGTGGGGDQRHTHEMAVEDSSGRQHDLKVRVDYVFCSTDAAAVGGGDGTDSSSSCCGGGGGGGSGAVLVPESTRVVPVAKPGLALGRLSDHDAVRGDFRVVLRR